MVQFGSLLLENIQGRRGVFQLGFTQEYYWRFIFTEEHLDFKFTWSEYSWLNDKNVYYKSSIVPRRKNGGNVSNTFKRRPVNLLTLFAIWP